VLAGDAARHRELLLAEGLIDGLLADARVEQLEGEEAPQHHHQPALRDWAQAPLGLVAGLLGARVRHHGSNPA
jgi:hypothetical protein